MHIINGLHTCFCVSVCSHCKGCPSRNATSLHYPKHFHRALHALQALPYSLMPPTQEATAALQPYHMAPSSGQGSSNPLPYNATSTEEQGASDLLSILLLPSVKLTCLGSAEVHLTPQQISQLPLGQYANLYTVCLRKVCVTSNLFS